MPELTASDGISTHAFVNSAVFVTFAIIMCGLGARTLAYSLSRLVGISGGIIFLILFGALGFHYIYSGFQCALWTWMQMMLIVLLFTDNLPQVAQTEIGKSVGLQELPGTAVSSDGLKQCGRLVACRESKMFRNHKIQVDKYETCVQCAETDLGFESLPPGQENRDTHKYHRCSDGKADVAKCRRTAGTCPMTAAALQTAGLAQMDVSTVCAQSKGTLCVFASTGTETLGYAGPVDVDTNIDGLGFPTFAACEAKHPTATCAKRGACAQFDEPPKTNCFCDRYRRVGQFGDPCDFLEKSCDEKGPFFAEAQQLAERRKTSITDIVDIDDGRALVERLDEALGL